MQLLNTPEAKQAANNRKLVRQQQLRERFENGDSTIRKTLLGKFVTKKAGGILIASAEATRYAYTAMPLPRKFIEEILEQGQATPAAESLDQMGAEPGLDTTPSPDETTHQQLAVPTDPEISA